MITSIPITIDLTKAYLPHINLVQGESAGRRLSFTLVSGGTAVDLTGKIIILVAVKPSGLIVTSPLIITAATSGKAYTDVLTQMVAEVGALSLQIRIFTPGVTGTATSGGATYLYDTSKSWTPGAYVGQWLYISSGTGAGQARRITANTATQLTVSDAWETNPTAGSGYAIIYETGYSFPFAATVAASPNADAAIVSSSDFSALTAALATAAGLDANAVHKTGNETIAGTKTFSASPVVPDPSANTHAATKYYVDYQKSALSAEITALINQKSARCFVISEHAISASTGTGTQTISFPTGRFTAAPSVIRIRCAMGISLFVSFGTWTVDGQAVVDRLPSGTGAGSFEPLSGKIINMSDAAANAFDAYVTNVTKDSFDLVWTRVGAGHTGTVTMQIEAEG